MFFFKFYYWKPIQLFSTVIFSFYSAMKNWESLRSRKYWERWSKASFIKIEIRPNISFSISFNFETSMTKRYCFMPMFITVKMQKMSRKYPENEFSWAFSILEMVRKCKMKLTVFCVMDRMKWWWKNSFRFLKLKKYFFKCVKICEI